MSIQISQKTSFKMCFPGLLLFILYIWISPINAQVNDLVLQDTTITGVTTFTAINSITVGPNVTIATSAKASFVTGNLIHFKPGFSVIKGGRLNVIKDVTVDIILEEPVLPVEFIVYQNYPNPFNPVTHIHYQLTDYEKVSIIVYNIVGQKIRTLISQNQTPGYHTVIWDGTNDAGQKVGSGIFIYRVNAGEYSVVKKMALLK